MENSQMHSHSPLGGQSNDDGHGSQPTRKTSSSSKSTTSFDSPSAPVGGLASNNGQTGNSSNTRPTRPKPLQRLSGLPQAFKINFRKGSNRMVTPIDASEPLGLLCVRILGARGLAVKDRNGKSDPFLHIRLGEGRAESDVVKACLNPAWGSIDEEPFKSTFVPDGKAHKEAFCVAPVWRETVRRTRIEVVVWDKDSFKKNEYMGEISLSADEWVNAVEDRLNIAYNDPGNQARWRPLVSSRKRSEVSGELLVKVGWIGYPPMSPETSRKPSNGGRRASSSPERSMHSTTVLSATASAYTATSHIAASTVADYSVKHRMTAEQEKTVNDVLMQSVLLDKFASLGLGATVKNASPVGRLRSGSIYSKQSTKQEMVFDAPPNEGVGTLRIGEKYKGALSQSITDRGDLYDSDSSDMTEAEHGNHDHLDAHYSSDSSAMDGSDAGGDADDYFDLALGMQDAPKVPQTAAAQLQSHTVQGVASEGSQQLLVPSAPTTPGLQSSQKRRLGVPGFLKRASSFSSMHRHSTSMPSLPASSSQDVPTLAVDGVPGSGASTPGLMTPGATTPGAYRRKKFTRRKVYLGVDDSADVGGVTVDGKRGKGGDKSKKQAKTGTRRKASQLSPIEKDKGGLSTGAQDEETLGIVFLEIKGASNLPRWRNVTRTGWDMDPFVIVSFGKKIFRTRVIRHSRNPVWDERLFFHVQTHEHAYQVLFTILDWDKLSSNDYVGEVSLLLKELTDQAPKPDPETGVFKVHHDGKIFGDDLRDLSLNISSRSPELEDDKTRMNLQVRAKFTPYSALRQRFWRTYLKQYDTDDSESWSLVELLTMLDSLGSTMTRATIESFFTRFNKTPEQSLSIDEALICLEDQLTKPRSEKREVDKVSAAEATDGGHDATSSHSGAGTPSPELSLADNATGSGMSFTGLPLTGEPANGVPAKDQPASGIDTFDATSAQHLQQDASSSSLRLPGMTPSRQSSVLTESGAESGVEHQELEKIINIRTCPLCHKQLHKKAEVDMVSHLAVCASQDWSSLNSLTVANFVSTSQAQRKWFSKFVNKVSNGAYKLGADSANILVQNRMTGQLQEEKMQVYVRVGIRLWYRAAGSSSRMEANRIKKLLRNMTTKQGAKFNAPESVAEIERFIAFHGLDINEILEPLDSFKHFNAFFYRKLKPDARPCEDPDDPMTLVSSADCRFTCFQTIHEATQLWIKGRTFTIKKLLGDMYKDEAARYEGGSVCIFRLAPQDYHRYHSGVDGKIGKMSAISGEYYTVNPIAIRSGLDVYAENARVIVPMDSPAFGRVMNVCIGAMMVGSIDFTKKEGDEVKRAEEYGYFAFGGSTILMLFEPNTVRFDNDLVNNSRACIETLVRVGMRIGKRA